MTAPTGGGTPAEEIDIDAGLVSRLIAVQHPDLAHLEVSPGAVGWDNVMFRLGDDLAVRLPKRRVAVPLLAKEQIFLPTLAGSLPLPVSAPLRIGRPGDDFPWTWSILPWLPGKPADLAPPGPDQGGVWGGFLRALHRPAPEDAPRNPYRGVPLSARKGPVEERLARLRAHGVVTPMIEEFWSMALQTPLETETWLHGDPHSRNVLTDQGRFSAVIDWGDMCVGDPATDLASLWMLLDTPLARDEAIAAYGGLSPATLIRARGWAVMFGAMLLDAGLVDDPRLAAAGRVTLERLHDGP